MSEFKVGDKVRVLRNESNAFKEMDVLFEVGDITTVTKVLSNTPVVRIGYYSTNLISVSSLELVK